MKLSEILSPPFKSSRPQGPPAGLQGRTANTPSMVRQCRADDFEFFRPFLERRLLSEDQMHQACQRYRLGKSRSGKPIFWMIDERGRVLDGHIGDAWVSEMLKARHPEALKHCRTEHCLFGLHLLATENRATDHTDFHREANLCKSVKSVAKNNLCQSDNLCKSVKSVAKKSVAKKSVAIVERESAAVILSALFPDQIWLAAGYPANLTLDWFIPLRGHDITLFPHTDETMSSYVACLELAESLRHAFHFSVGPIEFGTSRGSTPKGSITVSPLLEDHATPEQKRREIDLLNFILE